MFRSTVEACSPMSVDSDRSRDESMNISDCYTNSPVLSRNPSAPYNHVTTPANPGQRASLFSPIERAANLFDDLNLGPCDFGRSPNFTMTPNRPKALSPVNHTDIQRNQLGYLGLDEVKSKDFLRKRHTIAAFKMADLDSNDNSVLFDQSSKIESPVVQKSKNGSKKKKGSQKDNVVLRKQSCCSCSRVLFTCLLLVGLSVFAYSLMKPHVCQYTLSVNTIKLNQTLKAEVYGQPIAVNVVSGSIERYLHGDYDKPALVLSLHGWTGVGKNHITNIIGSHIKTKTVKRFIIPLHYPHRDQDKAYKDQVIADTVNSLSVCSVNVIVFDEVDKAGPVLIEGISLAIQRALQAVKEDMKLIVLLLSNTGGRDINTHLYERLMEGGLRDDITEQELTDVLMNEKKYAQSWHYKLRKDKVIDRIIPLLPLAEKQVRRCIIRDMQLKGLEVTGSKVDQVNEQIQYFPADQPLFSVTGCRAVASKVDQVLL